MIIPEAVIPVYLKATRARAPFVSIESAGHAVRHAERRSARRRPPRLRSDVRIHAMRVHGAPVYVLTPAAGTPSGAVVYVHGGGWIHRIAPQHWSLTAQLAVEANVAVAVPMYPLLPSGSAQIAQELVLAIVHELRNEHGDVQLIGDSAGGQIALSAAQTLRDQGVPSVRTVLIAPALDLTFSNPSIPEVQPDDPWLAPGGARELGRRWAGDLDARDPVVSPLFGQFDGLGPMLVLSGTHDILNPDARIVVDRARAAGVDVRLIERAGALHVFPLLPTRSGRDARTEIVSAVGA
ncbi:acetyl esterase/lipase [Microbacterium sp. W4I4]|uniref:alpha/beta hydrolase fold domain-containing protein n=1 Tax=Microbacterium sp. W4I4 TaxID=3042295 RepID=UPI00277F3B87|nr:alpha/beta hydrolase [Microbacterium sp. W4I4]MDQ0613948.1 acetyl esterase/lipase [Microbacterium sp. W4I4]